MKTIQKLEEQLASLRDELKTTTDPERKGELEEQIDFIQDDIDEIEQDEIDAQDYDELTGNTSQDRYIENNRFALMQSDRIEQFRNEY